MTCTAHHTTPSALTTPTAEIEVYYIRKQCPSVPHSDLCTQDDGNLVIYDAIGRAAWNTRTNTPCESVIAREGQTRGYVGCFRVWGLMPAGQVSVPLVVGIRQPSVMAPRGTCVTSGWALFSRPCCCHNPSPSVAYSFLPTFGTPSPLPRALPFPPFPAALLPPICPPPPLPCPAGAFRFPTSSWLSSCTDNTYANGLISGSCAFSVKVKVAEGRGVGHAHAVCSAGRSII